MSQDENKPDTATKSKTKAQMLDELKSLSDMLDDDFDEDTPSRPISEDIPVLKSFVEDVPVLNESPEESKAPPLDTVDRDGATFSTSPASGFNKGSLDMSFLDKDPLEISEQIRNRNNPDKPASANPSAAAALSTAEPNKPIQKPAQSPPQSQAQSTENPFLPRSTLDKLRESHNRSSNRTRPADNSSDASAQLRQLLQDNPLNKLSFELNPSSREYQALRQKASQMVNEVIRANMHRLEAELRMKLEQEVDRMFKDAKKK